MPSEISQEELAEELRRRLTLLEGELGEQQAS